MYACNYNIIINIFMILLVLKEHEDTIIDGLR